jgi:hypothetical protein
VTAGSVAPRASLGAADSPSVSEPVDSKGAYSPRAAELESSERTTSAEAKTREAARTERAALARERALLDKEHHERRVMEYLEQHRVVYTNAP